MKNLTIGTQVKLIGKYRTGETGPIVEVLCNNLFGRRMFGVSLATPGAFNGVVTADLSEAEIVATDDVLALPHVSVARQFAARYPLCGAAGLTFEMAMQVRNLKERGFATKRDSKWRYENGYFAGSGMQFASTVRGLVVRGLVVREGQRITLTDAGQAVYATIVAEVQPSERAA